MKSLETAEEMYRRLASNPGFELPHPDCCEVRKEEHVTCPKCQLSNEHDRILILCSLEIGVDWALWGPGY